MILLRRCPGHLEHDALVHAELVLGHGVRRPVGLGRLPHRWGSEHGHEVAVRRCRPVVGAGVVTTTRVPVVGVPVVGASGVGVPVLGVGPVSRSLAAGVSVPVADDDGLVVFLARVVCVATSSCQQCEGNDEHEPTVCVRACRDPRSSRRGSAWISPRTVAEATRGDLTHPPVACGRSVRRGGTGSGVRRTPRGRGRASRRCGRWRR